jgi:hypothetical protein
MRKGHRAFHHLFWYCALPILLAWLIMISPDDQLGAASESEVPPGANISIVEPSR